MRWQHKRDPWIPADYDLDVLYAIRGVASGTATPAQQTLAFGWIMYVAGESDWPFRPGAEGARGTDLVLGKQFVAKQIRKMLEPETLEALVRERDAAETKAAKGGRGRLITDGDDKHG